MVRTALVFGMDQRGRVRHAREFAFTSRADLLRQLGPVFAQHPLVEAWDGAVCVYRRGRAGRLDFDEAETEGRGRAAGHLG